MEREDDEGVRCVCVCVGGGTFGFIFFCVVRDSRNIFGPVGWKFVGNS
jgi:hypothetical protein